MKNSTADKATNDKLADVGDNTCGGCGVIVSSPYEGFGKTSTKGDLKISTLHDANQHVRALYLSISDGKWAVLVDLVKLSNAYLKRTGEAMKETAARLLGEDDAQQGLAKRLLQLLPGVSVSTNGTSCYVSIEAPTESTPLVSTFAESGSTGFFAKSVRTVKRLFSALYGRKQVLSSTANGDALSEGASAPTATRPIQTIVTRCRESEALLVRSEKSFIYVSDKVIAVLRGIIAEPYRTLPDEMVRELVWRRVRLALLERAFVKLSGDKGDTYIVNLCVLDKYKRNEIYAEIRLSRKGDGSTLCSLQRVAPFGDTCVLPNGTRSYFGRHLFKTLGANQPARPVHILGQAFEYNQPCSEHWEHLADAPHMERARTALGQRFADCSGEKIVQMVGEAFDRACKEGEQGNSRFVPASAWHMGRRVWNWYLPLYCAPGAATPELVALVCKETATTYRWVTIIPTKDMARKLLATNNEQASWVFEVLQGAIPTPQTAD